MKRLGLIVNPIAGMGGPVGLKGTDGRSTYEEALRRGSVPRAEQRARDALRALEAYRHNLEILACAGPMGKNVVSEAGFDCRVVLDHFQGEFSTSKDTIRAAHLMRKESADLVLFAGGDGTARDVCEAIGTFVPALGIPAGVKIHSGVFAVSPKRAGEMAKTFLFGGARGRTKEMEVMDIDEDAFRKDRVQARLYGYLSVPWDRGRVQGSKAGSAASEQASQQAVAEDIVERMLPERAYILAPGTTVREIARRLGVEKTLLGIDAVKGGRLLARDLNEKELLELLQKEACTIVVSPIGGQGYIFGRGNQQISPRVIWATGKENILVAATPHKLATLAGRPLLLDTGDVKLDRVLKGPWPIVTGYHETSMYPVSF
ncbi:MAG: ATP-NAD kinase family protein [Thermovirgaceae bacterium]